MSIDLPQTLIINLLNVKLVRCLTCSGCIRPDVSSARNQMKGAPMEERWLCTD